MKQRHPYSIVVIITTIFSIFSLFNATVAPVMALTAEQTGAISQNCGSIKQSLKSLQKADSRLRVLLGTTYQTLLINYITPLNLRLVKDNNPNTELTELQATFNAQRDRFSRQFISYSQSLEELIAIDCVNKPEEFYAKLDQARARRANLAQTVAELSDTISQHHTTVLNLRNTLQEDANV